MKNLQKTLTVAAASIALVPALFSTSAFATSPGSLAGGSSLYNVRNTTTNTQYSSVASATCDQTVKYSIELSNTEFGTISNITVTAPLTGDIAVSGTNSAHTATTSTGKVSVTALKGTLTYDAGTTKVLDVNGTQLRALGDTITTTGVNAGALAGSTREYVQFTATVKCVTTPTTPVTPTAPTTPAAPTTPVAPAAPALPSTGAGDMVLPALSLAGISAAAVYFIRSRRALRA